MDSKEQEQMKECVGCTTMRPVREFASHIDPKTNVRYYRKQCRECAKIKYRATHGKPQGIARHLTAQEIDRIRDNAALFTADATGQYPMSMRKAYAVCKPGVSLGIWYRAFASGNLAQIAKEQKT
jgi:hypothetical protein